MMFGFYVKIILKFYLLKLNNLLNYMVVCKKKKLYNEIKFLYGRYVDILESLENCVYFF